jgi:hypothetical protein
MQFLTMDILPERSQNKRKYRVAIDNCCNASFLDEEEKTCLLQWSLRHCINSDYYHINFLLKELEQNKNFLPNSHDIIDITHYFNREKTNSYYHKLWVALYFFDRCIKNKIY